MMSKDILAYCMRAVVQHLNGNFEQFMKYRNKAIDIYEEETSIATVAEVIPESTKTRLYEMVS